MIWRRLFLCLVVVALAAACLSVAAADDSSEGREELVPIPTLGGKQFWADELLFHDWRIQCNVIDGEYRLLDGNNLRHTSGTFDQCRNKLDEIKQSRRLPPMRGTVVIVLHGLGRTRGSMDTLCRYLEQRGQWSVLNVSYPSTRRTIDEHAASLARIIDHLEGVDTFHFVAHSMGNIVVRRYLFDRIDPAARRLVDGRFGRMVMLGPPNRGSILATMLAENKLFVAIEGEPGRQLGVDWPVLESRLATPPPLVFGIIAGGRDDGRGYNPALPGDDDGMVTVASTYLAGAADFLLLPVLHTVLVSDDDVLRYTLCFLETGRFVEPQTP